MIESRKNNGGAPRATAHCDIPECDRTEVIPCAYHRVGNGRAEPDQKQAHAKLQGQGWSYVKGKLRCPSCEAKRKVVPMKAVEAPREPTRAQKREIMDMLETAYDVENERYTGGDTDDTVADVLKVLPGWVAQIREEFFGPAGGNDDMAALRIELEQFITDGEKQIKAGETWVASMSRAVERARDYKTRLAGIERAVGPRVMKRA
jgi:hypothetical protein